MPFEPPGKYAWDLWFAHDGANQHIFYLQASKEACDNKFENAKYRSNVGHAILKDGTPTDVCADYVFKASTTSNTWDNLSIWTGSIIRDPESKKYLLFYTANCREDKPVAVPNEMIRPQNIGLAISNNLIDWQRHPNSIKTPLIPHPTDHEFLDGITWRDPFVFKLGNSFCCLITARLNPNSTYGIESEDQGGCIVYLSSPNLFDWSNSKPEMLVASKHFCQMEVPQLFARYDGNFKTFYLLFCAQVKDMSSSRLREMPEEECLSGTYLFKSEPVPIDSTALPRFDNRPAKILTPGLYAGRILDPDEGKLQIYGFKIDPHSGTYLGGIINSIIEISD